MNKFERNMDPKKAIDIGLIGERGVEFYKKKFKREFKILNNIIKLSSNYNNKFNKDYYSDYGYHYEMWGETGGYRFSIKFLLPNKKDAKPGWEIKKQIAFSSYSEPQLKGGTLKQLLDYFIPLRIKHLNSSLKTYHEWLDKAEKELDLVMIHAKTRHKK